MDSLKTRLEGNPPFHLIIEPPPGTLDPNSFRVYIAEPHPENHGHTIGDVIEYEQEQKALVRTATGLIDIDLLGLQWNDSFAVRAGRYKGIVYVKIDGKPIEGNFVWEIREEDLPVMEKAGKKVKYTSLEYMAKDIARKKAEVDQEQKRLDAEIEALKQKGAEAGNLREETDRLMSSLTERRDALQKALEHAQAELVQAQASEQAGMEANARAKSKQQEAEQGELDALQRMEKAIAKNELAIKKDQEAEQNMANAESKQEMADEALAGARSTFEEVAQLLIETKEVQGKIREIAGSEESSAGASAVTMAALTVMAFFAFLAVHMI